MGGEPSRKRARQDDAGQKGEGGEDSSESPIVEGRPGSLDINIADVAIFSWTLRRVINIEEWRGDGSNIAGVFYMPTNLIDPFISTNPEALENMASVGARLFYENDGVELARAFNRHKILSAGISLSSFIPYNEKISDAILSTAGSTAPYVNVGMDMDGRYTMWDGDRACVGGEIDSNMAEPLKRDGGFYIRNEALQRTTGSNNCLLNAFSHVEQLHPGAKWSRQWRVHGDGTEGITSLVPSANVGLSTQENTFIQMPNSTYATNYDDDGSSFRANSHYNSSVGYNRVPVIGPTNTGAYPTLSAVGMAPAQRTKSYTPMYLWMDQGDTGAVNKGRLTVEHSMTMVAFARTENPFSDMEGSSSGTNAVSQDGLDYTPYTTFRLESAIGSDYSRLPTGALRHHTSVLA